jgi:hypothetical protein
LDRLRSEIASCTSEPYLLTITAEHRPHSGTVTVDWDAAGTALLVGPAPSSWPESDARGYRQVTLLWPPAEPGGYSLIVDGPARTVHNGGQPQLEVTPAKAVWHRRGPAPASATSSCGSDCIPIHTA